MARTNASKTETPQPDLEVSDPNEKETQKEPETQKAETQKEPETKVTEALPDSIDDAQDVDSILNSLKTLLSTVEKLQKVRQEVGDIKPLLVRMLDGELVSGEELEQLKTGVGGLLRLVRAYSDHQTALTKAQPARSLLDEVLKV